MKRHVYKRSARDTAASISGRNPARCARGIICAISAQTRVAPVEDGGLWQVVGVCDPVLVRLITHVSTLLPPQGLFVRVLEIPVPYQEGCPVYVVDVSPGNINCKRLTGSQYLPCIVRVWLI